MSGVQDFVVVDLGNRSKRYWATDVAELYHRKEKFREEVEALKVQISQLERAAKETW
jgi:sugar-specific transcriptional regulator TrmB